MVKRILAGFVGDMRDMKIMLAVVGVILLSASILFFNTRSSESLVVMDKNCPCDLEGYLDKSWTSVCVVPPYVPASVFEAYSGGKEPVSLDQDVEWGLAFYNINKLTKLFIANVGEIKLGASKLVCKERSRAMYEVKNSEFFLIERDFK